MTRTIPGLGVLELLNAAYVGITAHIKPVGDGLLPVPNGILMWWRLDGVQLHTQNANNHQTTWAVLAAAVIALGDYMHSFEIYGAVDFDIWDGFNQVGHGTSWAAEMTAKKYLSCECSPPRHQRQATVGHRRPPKLKTGSFVPDHNTASLIP